MRTKSAIMNQHDKQSAINFKLRAFKLNIDLLSDYLNFIFAIIKFQ